MKIYTQFINDKKAILVFMSMDTINKDFCTMHNLYIIIFKTTYCHWVGEERESLLSCNAVT